MEIQEKNSPLGPQLYIWSTQAPKVMTVLHLEHPGPNVMTVIRLEQPGPNVMTVIRLEHPSPKVMKE